MTELHVLVGRSRKCSLAPRPSSCEALTNSTENTSCCSASRPLATGTGANDLAKRACTTIPVPALARQRIRLPENHLGVGVVASPGHVLCCWPDSTWGVHVVFAHWDAIRNGQRSTTAPENARIYIRRGYGTMSLSSLVEWLDWYSLRTLLNVRALSPNMHVGRMGLPSRNTSTSCA
jgi:hypothetical protein